MKNLDSYGVVEMSQQDMMMVEGGSWFSNAVKAVGEFISEIVDVAIIVKKLIDTIKSF